MAALGFHMLGSPSPSRRLVLTNHMSYKTVLSKKVLMFLSKKKILKLLKVKKRTVCSCSAFTVLRKPNVKCRALETQTLSGPEAGSCILQARPAGRPSGARSLMPRPGLGRACAEASFDTPPPRTVQGEQRPSAFHEAEELGPQASKLSPEPTEELASRLTSCRWRSRDWPGRAQPCRPPRAQGTDQALWNEGWRTRDKP